MKKLGDVDVTTNACKRNGNSIVNAEGKTYEEFLQANATYQAKCLEYFGDPSATPGTPEYKGTFAVYQDNLAKAQAYYLAMAEDYAGTRAQAPDSKDLPSADDLTAPVAPTAPTFTPAYEGAFLLDVNGQVLTYSDNYGSKPDTIRLNGIYAQNSKVTITNGRITGNGAGDAGILVKAGSVLTVNSGTITSIYDGIHW